MSGAPKPAGVAAVGQSPPENNCGPQGAAVVTKYAPKPPILPSGVIVKPAVREAPYHTLPSPSMTLVLHGPYAVVAPAAESSSRVAPRFQSGRTTLLYESK